MLFTLQKRSAQAPISLPMDVRQDMVRNGTRGPVLLLLDSCEGMSTDIDNWMKFRVEFTKLDVWIAVAMQGGDQNLKTAPPGVWSDECSEWPNRRFAIFELRAVLTAYFMPNSQDLKSNHILMLWAGANKAREKNL